MPEKKDLFDFMLKRVKETSSMTGEKEPQAFIRWFVNLYFMQPQKFFSSDGKHDGKVDAFFESNDGIEVTHHVINSKFTSIYNKLAPPAFYNEIAFFHNAFNNKGIREDFIERAVTTELRPKYRQLFKYFDDGNAKLTFVTNHRRNEDFYPAVKNLNNLEIFHLDELIQHLIDDIDGAMPKTSRLLLTGIQTVLSADKEDTEVSTSIVFARLIDFIKYMENDPYDLLFARNIRVAFSINKSAVNKAILETFRDNPKEFAYSNNGITVLCEHHTYDPGLKELEIINPRVVNGSQTLHTVRDVKNPNSNSRVMVRIIEIPPVSDKDVPQQVTWKKDVIAKIAVRSNQQNPIKKWNLVSNDDFQLELYRYFRRKGLYYERREGEWNHRSRELRSANIVKGPGIKKLAQLMSSYYWDKPVLGPANSKQSVGELFEGKAYEQIRKTQPELAYQLFLISKNIDDSYKQLSKISKTVKGFRGHIDFILLSMIIRTLWESGAAFGNPELTKTLEDQRTGDKLISKYNLGWRQLTKELTSFIINCYKLEEQRVFKEEDIILTYNNYFKSNSYVGKVLHKTISPQFKKIAKSLIV